MLGPIKDLFFRRMKSLNGELPDYYTYELSQTIRHKIIGTILDHRYYKEGFATLMSAYDEVHEFIIMLEREFGKNLSNEYDAYKKIQDFLFKCSTDEFLTSIEVLVTLKHNNMNRFGDNSLFSFIQKVNEIFKIDKIGYEIVPAGLDRLPFIIIPYNSQYLHLETIKKPLSLMHDEDFKGALNEFEEALDEYRKEQYKDAIHKANKSYESTLKTILDLQKVAYDEARDKIPQLVLKIKNNANIIDSNLQSTFDSFWSVLQNGPPTIRNQPGIGHGQGLDIKDIEKSYADFVLRLTGTYIVFLIERYKETNENS